MFPLYVYVWLDTGVIYRSGCVLKGVHKPESVMGVILILLPVEKKLRADRDRDYKM